MQLNLFTMQRSLVALALLAHVLPTFALPAPTKKESVALLITAASAVDRINLLDDIDFKFDFFNPKPDEVTASGPDGRIVTARRDTFPALVGNGVALSVGFLGPCGLNTPHTHPRATEFNLAINGSMRTGMLQENEARFVMETLEPGQATIFPRGAIHFEQNLGCEPIIFIAAFSDEDPGSSGVANNFFKLPGDIVGATLGGLGAKEVSTLDAAIPKNIAFGVDQCLKTCGLKRT
jgi:oxalate decarboxylase/phosphoglucose isomerase-like protein (cupin superfamily)